MKYSTYTWDHKFGHVAKSIIKSESCLKKD